MMRVLLLIVIITIISNTSTNHAQIASPDEPPPPMPLISTPGDPLLVLLMGADTQVQSNNGRTDVLLLIAIDETAGTVSFMSVPRDLYVNVPGHGMSRINTAYAYGEMDNPGTGPEVLLQTIRESLGLEVNYWARVDFADFRHLIDDLGGVDIVVDCAIEDWRLKEPGLDPTLEENWAQFTLPVGVHTMDGDLALWYARSRRTSSDFDRGRRHQALIHAVWRRVRELGLDTQLAAVWPQLLDLVDTNLPLDRVLQLVPLGVSLSPSRIAHFTLHSGQEVTSWRSPEGSSVLVPNREALERTIRQFLTPPTANQLRANPVSVEIINATGVRGMDTVAAWRLGWEGVHVIIGPPAARSLPTTQVINLTGQTKGESSNLLTNALNVSASSVRVLPNAERSTDYQIVIGQDYYPCTYGVISTSP